MEKKSFTFLEIKQKMANYCAYQDRCHAEVEQKLKDFLLVPEAKDEIILYLIKENFLNEERFTRSYIRGKFYIKNWGKNKIRSHLKQKGITEKLIEKGMVEIDNKDYCHTLQNTFNKYYAKQTGKDFQKKHKSIRYLISRGFEYNEILKSLEPEE